MSEITMPRLSDSMEEGTLLAWLKSDGDRIEVGDELVEIETDKATMTYESPAAGILEVLIGEGESVEVDRPIARVGTGAERQPEQEAPRPPAITQGGQTPASPRTSMRATPLARRVAAEHRVDLGSLTGTGPRGRVTRGDVLASIGQHVPAPPAPSVAALEPTRPRSNGSIQAFTRVQQTIAQRMSQVKATVPDFQVQTEVTVDTILELRGQMKEAPQVTPSINDFIVKAAALALREFPLLNSSFAEDGVELHSAINIGVAVAADGALIVPTVTYADARSIGSIATEVKRLAAAVRDGSITASELSGATFTISNLGMYGMTAITPIINAPQAAILGVGAARAVLARVAGEIIERQLMTLTLSSDHRVVYGADAAQFLTRIHELLEKPLLLAF
jgi:pyruvate dehydrogenase E2 component (dihydrolipoamide acetyltransferase)